MTTFPVLKNDLMLRVIRGERVERTPVWVMRQAGRYLPEFREIRKQHDFFTVCQTPTLASKVTLQPIRHFPNLLDAAIIFSDILIIPQILGFQIKMNPSPNFLNPIKNLTLEQVEEMVLDYDESDENVKRDLGYVYDAITLTRYELNGEVPLIGFCGSPWTLLAYMIQGGGSKDFAVAKTWVWQNQDFAKKLLDKLARICARFLIGQVRAGAQLLQVFDSWAIHLSPEDFDKFSLPYLKLISDLVRNQMDSSQPQSNQSNQPSQPQPQSSTQSQSSSESNSQSTSNSNSNSSSSSSKIPSTPLILFPLGANQALNRLSRIGYDVISLHWSADLKGVVRDIREGGGGGGTELGDGDEPRTKDGDGTELGDGDEPRTTGDGDGDGTELGDGDERRRTRRTRTKIELTFQGNLDPSILLLSPEKIDEKVKEMFEKFDDEMVLNNYNYNYNYNSISINNNKDKDKDNDGNNKNKNFNFHFNHIANLGHGITPEVDAENGMKVFLECVHKYGKKK